MEQAKQVYKCQGIRMTEQEAREKIAEIVDLNNANNEVLNGLKLGYGYKKGKLPDKLSQDLGDIYQTCVIESNLIKEVRSLSLSYSQLEAKLALTMNQKGLEVEKERRRIQEMDKRNKALQAKLAFAEKYQQKNRTLQMQIIKLRRQVEQIHGKMDYFEKENRRLRKDHDQLNRLRDEEWRKRDFKKGFEKISDVGLPIGAVKNSQHEKQMLKTSEVMRLVESERQTKREQLLAEENDKLREWMKRFIQAIERILQIRLQKLRQSATSEHQIPTLYKYLPRMHINTMTQFYEPFEFPYADILNDFQLVVRQAQSLKFQHEKYNRMERIETLNKELVERVISELIGCQGQIVEEFKLAGEKREQLAYEYEHLVKGFDFSCLELVNQMTIDKLRQFQQQPQRIVKEIQNELEDFRKHRHQVQQLLQPQEPSVLQRRKEIAQQAKQTLEDYRNEALRENRKQYYIQQIQSQTENRNNQANNIIKSNDNTGSERRRSDRELMEEARRFVKGRLERKSFLKQFQQLEAQIKDKSLLELRQIYMAAFLPQHEQPSDKLNRQLNPNSFNNPPISQPQLSNQLSGLSSIPSQTTSTFNQPIQNQTMNREENEKKQTTSSNAQLQHFDPNKEWQI